MRRTMSVLRPVLVAVSAGLLLVAPAAHAQQAPRAALHLAVEAHGGTNPVEATLTCAPNGGSHPRSEMACEALRQAHGHLAELPSMAEPCTMEYRPTRAEATGHWLGEPVRFRHTYDNPCLAARESGGVLDLYPRVEVST